MDLFRDTSFDISGLVTKRYSSSFYLSTLLLDKKTKESIHGIYGFVRFADEIVDTFHNHNKASLLQKFEQDLKEALRDKISLNPILNAFQSTVNEYRIPYEYIDAFLSSMKMDLDKKQYLSPEETARYIYGSADAVGLMCVKVFCKQNELLFDELQVSAMKLGSAFQKVNFLRDLKVDNEQLGRSYFSNIDIKNFSENDKTHLIKEIEDDFHEARLGIKRLPGRSRLAVFTAYTYYHSLLKKIRKTPSVEIIEKRIRISNGYKLLLLGRAYMEYRLNLI